MARIVYLLLSGGRGVAGGQKMIVRHVETLCELGFDAICYVVAGCSPPVWFDHAAPLEHATPVRPDDIIVLPDDGPEAFALAASSGARAVIFSQNPYSFAAQTFGLMDRFSTMPPVMVVSEGMARTVRRAFPGVQVEVVPCFADERRFRPLPNTAAAVAYAPRKRPLEAAAIRGLFDRLHSRHSGLAWWELKNRREPEVATAFGAASLHLSLSRLESVGMTTLEAMACGCVCAGFVGVGGAEYASPDNGFWAPEDDCEAAADALAQAADLHATGGAPLARMIEAARATAAEWSYARFRERLAETWEMLAPDARRLAA